MVWASLVYVRVKMPKLLEAKPLVESRIIELKNQCEQLKKKQIQPSMKVVLVGENPASLSYIKNKQKLCEQIGASFKLVQLDIAVSETEFLQEINKINLDKKTHGAIVQLPLPDHLSKLDVSNLIEARKDIDGFHSENIYGVFSGKDTLFPCTPKGIMSLCKHYKIELTGKKVVIIGRSLIVGKPLAMLMLNQNATVTICHSKTQDLKNETKKADIIIAAIGKANFVDSTFLNDSKKQILIDVGINKVNGKLCGDINFDDVKDKVQAITPVPGGVGPLTVLSLIENLLTAVGKQNE